MSSTLQPILIALCVVLLVSGISQALTTALKGEKRKIKNRLSHEGSFDPEAGRHQAVTLQIEATGLSGSLARQTIFQPMYRRLLQAYPELPFSRFLMICAGLTLVGFLLASSLSNPGVGLLVGLGCGYIPVLAVNTKRSRRQKQIALQLPEALEFLSRILRAGHSLSTGLQMMSEELPKPLSEDFKRCYSQHSLGQSIDEALKDMARHIESTDFAFFVTAVLIQRQTGGDLSEVLNNISNMIRQRIRLQQHVKAKTAEGRLTGYILVAFPAIMFAISYFLNPEHAGKLIHDNTGIMLLVIAFVLQMLGLYSIRKITVVRV